jgi:CheY-like chemotaxis protein
MTVERVKVLCVDDDANVLESLGDSLEDDYEVVTALNGPRALELLDRKGPFTVVISDMRMPEMDGAELLGHVRKQSPDSVRILLTGQTDLEGAIAAVNRGHIFRFLVKPCPPPQLLGAVRAAVLQYKMATAEKVLLEQTLRGAVKVLFDVLALSSPRAFGRATRIKRLAQDLAEIVPPGQRWQIEVAAMLTHLGWVSFPAEIVDKLDGRAPLDAAEQAIVARAPQVAEGLIANIPRLEVVRGMLALYPQTPSRTAPQKDDLVGLGARILRLAVDFEALESDGLSAADAIATLRGRGAHDAALLDILAERHGGDPRCAVIRELPLRALVEGMTLADDVRLKNGTLLVRRGYEITHGFLECARNFGPGAVHEPIRIVERAATPDGKRRRPA